METVLELQFDSLAFAEGTSNDWGFRPLSIIADLAAPTADEVLLKTEFKLNKYVSEEKLKEFLDRYKNLKTKGKVSLEDAVKYGEFILVSAPPQEHILRYVDK